jgi:hypothetical protein
MEFIVSCSCLVRVVDGGDRRYGICVVSTVVGL